MIKHALFFAAVMLVAGYLLRGTDNGNMIVTVLVPIWLVTSPMMRQGRRKEEDC